MTPSPLASAVVHRPFINEGPSAVAASSFFGGGPELSSHPLVSIIVPSFNQGRFLRETIDSCLTQDWRPLEVLVYDGGSTDESVDVLRSYGDSPELRWRSERDRGVVDAVNKGLREARGEILAIQSSDDVFLPGAVRRAVETLAASPELGFVCGDVEYIDERSRVTSRSSLPPFSVPGFLQKSTYVPQPSTFFRREAAQEAGFWDEGIPYAADAEYWLRIALARPVRKVDELWAGYRYHEAQRDKASSAPARDWERGVRRLLDDGRIPRPLRSRAESGIWLTWHHYTTEEDWKRRTAFLCRAALARPVVVTEPWFPKRELLPGREPIWKALSRAKKVVGTLLFDHPRLAWPLWWKGAARSRWGSFRNRADEVEAGPGGKGVSLSTPWTSDLNLAATLPDHGARLMRAALTEHPVVLTSSGADPESDPEVSFVIGHRGRARLPHLTATLATLRSQKDVRVEVVVVEQDETPGLAGELPGWVRYVASRAPERMPYARSWAFNVGARHAKGRVLVFHDNDILAPCTYAAELRRLASEGWEAVRALRFLFCLDDEGTARTFSSHDVPAHVVPRSVMQNAVGGTIAVTREAYEAVGGHDEAFVGWGGEDNELFDRLRTRRLWRWGYLPFVHLEHPRQHLAGRNDDASSLLGRKLAIPAGERIARLRTLPWGSEAPVTEMD